MPEPPAGPSQLRILQILQHFPAQGDVLAPQHRFSHFPALGVPKGRPGPAPCPCAPGRGEPWQEERLSLLGSFQEKLGGTGRNGESFCPGMDPALPPSPQCSGRAGAVRPPRA